MDISQTEFYRRYSTVYENRAHDKYTVGSMMASLGFKRGTKYLKQKRVDGTRPFCYIMSYDELYVLFDKKDWIHSRDREDYGIDNDADEADKLQKIVETPASNSKSNPKPASKKVPPPVPPKPDHLKEDNKSSDTKTQSSKLAPSADRDHVVEFLDDVLSADNEPEPYGIPGPSSTLAEDESEEMPLKQSDPLKVKVSEFIVGKNKKGKLVFDDDKLNAMFNEEPEHSKPEPEPKVYTDRRFEDLYESAKRMWVSDEGDPEDFDWECLALEIEDLSNHKVHDSRNDYYHYSLNRAVQTLRHKINGNSRVSYNYPTNMEIAEMIRKYHNKQRGQMRVTPPEGYKTVPIEKIQGCPKVDEKEYAQAMGIEESSDDEADNANEDWYEALKQA